MKRLLITTVVFAWTAFSNISSAQFICDKSYKVIHRQEKKIKDVARRTAKQWIKQYKDTLHLTYDLKQEKLRIDLWEDLVWYRVDSVFCEKALKISTDSLFAEMKNKEVLVYSITWRFKNPDKTEGEIRLCFNIFGQWTFAEYRPKTWSGEGWQRFRNKTISPL